MKANDEYSKGWNDAIDSMKSQMKDVEDKFYVCATPAWEELRLSFKRLIRKQLESLKK